MRALKVSLLFSPNMSPIFDKNPIAQYNAAHSSFLINFYIAMNYLKVRTLTKIYYLFQCHLDLIRDPALAISMDDNDKRCSVDKNTARLI